MVTTVSSVLHGEDLEIVVPNHDQRIHSDVLRDGWIQIDRGL